MCVCVCIYIYIYINFFTDRAAFWTFNITNYEYGGIGLGISASLLITAPTEVFNLSCNCQSIADIYRSRAISICLLRHLAQDSECVVNLALVLQYTLKVKPLSPVTLVLPFIFFYWI